MGCQGTSIAIASPARKDAAQYAGEFAGPKRCFLLTIVMLMGEFVDSSAMDAIKELDSLAIRQKR